MPQRLTVPLYQRPCVWSRRLSGLLDRPATNAAVINVVESWIVRRRLLRLQSGDLGGAKSDNAWCFSRVAGGPVINELCEELLRLHP